MDYDLSHLSTVWSRVTHYVLERGEGCNVFTRDGKQLLDFTSGIGVVNTGHCHPAVVRAIREQAEKFIHAQVNCYYHEPLVALSHALDEITPAHLDTFFFSNSGAEAVEGAVKLARHATERPNIVVFQGGFHGRTAQTMAMTTAKTVYRFRYQPLPAGVFVAPFPDAFRMGRTPEEASAWALEELDLLLHTQVDPSEIAAMVIEPVLGEGGYIPVPGPFLKGLREVCDAHDILLIADEVQSGFGRTGKWFAHEHSGVKADILIMAKALGSGFPISSVGSSNNLMERWRVGTHGGTYGGNPIGCAAALATIDVLRRESLLENAAIRGDQLMDGLMRLQKTHDAIGDVRGLGLMIGCEFVEPGTRRPDGALCKRVADISAEAGLLLLTCGAYGNVIRWIAPLVVTESEIDRALGIFENALKAGLDR